MSFILAERDGRIPLASKLNIEGRSLIEGSIAGALKAAIDAHGPIILANRSSAAKRVYVMLKQLAKQQREIRAATWDNLERGYTTHEPDQTYGACD